MARTGLISDERAVRRLIKRYTKDRNWSMVESLFRTLGQIFEEQEASQ